jgi:hypothetical protein
MRRPTSAGDALCGAPCSCPSVGLRLCPESVRRPPVGCGGFVVPAVPRVSCGSLTRRELVS